MDKERKQERKNEKNECVFEIMKGRERRESGLGGRCMHLNQSLTKRPQKVFQNIRING